MLTPETISSPATAPTGTDSFTTDSSHPEVGYAAVFNLLGLYTSSESPHRQDNGSDLARQGQLGQIRLRPTIEKLPVMLVERIVLLCPLDHRRRCALENLLQRSVEVPVPSPCLLSQEPEPNARRWPVASRRSSA